MAKVILGFDVGGTKLELAVLSPQPNGDLEYRGKRWATLSRERIPTERNKGYASIIAHMRGLVERSLRDLNLSLRDVQAIGIGLPGTIHPQKQLMLNGNTMVMIGRNVAEDLQAALAFSGPVLSANDANCFALAETLLGAGRKHAETAAVTPDQLTAVGVILGTGCGGGVVINGKVFQGHRGGAAEIGHTILYHDGHPCYCGRRGCAEQYLSGPGLEALFSQRRSYQVKDIYSAHEIFELASQQDPVAEAVVSDYRQQLALFLGNLTTLFDPDFFVLGGGVSCQKVIYQGLTQGIRENTFLPDSDIPVYSSELGDSSGVYGAALLVMNSQNEIN